MSNLIQELTALTDYQQSRAHLFPSIESLRWFIRRNKLELISAGAILEIAGRIRVNPEAFDSVVLLAGKRAMQHAFGAVASANPSVDNERGCA